jgi:hypothetical protein
MNEIERAEQGIHRLSADLEAWNKRTENRTKMNIIRLCVAICALILGTKIIGAW